MGVSQSDGLGQIVPAARGGIQDVLEQLIRRGLDQRGGDVASEQAVFSGDLIVGFADELIFVLMNWRDKGHRAAGVGSLRKIAKDLYGCRIVQCGRNLVARE